jgi:hypothetical protein
MELVRYRVEEYLRNALGFHGERRLPLHVLRPLAFHDEGEGPAQGEDEAVIAHPPRPPPGRRDGDDADRPVPDDRGKATESGGLRAPGSVPAGLFLAHRAADRVHGLGIDGDRPIRRGDDAEPLAVGDEEKGIRLAEAPDQGNRGLRRLADRDAPRERQRRFEKECVAPFTLAEHPLLPAEPRHEGPGDDRHEEIGDEEENVLRGGYPERVPRFHEEEIEDEGAYHREDGDGHGSHEEGEAEHRR